MDQQSLAVEIDCSAVVQVLKLAGDARGRDDDEGVARRRLETAGQDEIDPGEIDGAGHVELRVIAVNSRALDGDRQVRAERYECRGNVRTARERLHAAGA